MAGIGEMRSYVALSHYEQIITDGGVSERTLVKSYGYFAHITEQNPVERMESGVALGMKAIKMELVYIIPVITVGDEVLYNSCTYRIISREDDKFINRTYLYATANDRH